MGLPHDTIPDSPCRKEPVAVCFGNSIPSVPSQKLFFSSRSQKPPLIYEEAHVILQVGHDEWCRYDHSL